MNKYNKFLLISPHGNVGTNVSFHGVGGRGYTTNVDQAEVMTFEEAQEHVTLKRGRRFEEHPISLDKIEPFLKRRVDCQYFNYEFKEDPNDQYLIVKRGHYNGNDLAFACGLSHTYNLDMATAYTLSEAQKLIGDNKKSYCTISLTQANELSRRVFDESDINRRSMVFGAGIVGLRKPRARQDSGKVRWNCPSCGRIVWQYNPYDFEGCKNADCKEWSWR